ncbi:hypothetical protein EJ04DRAFT_503932 [Polyplosphaeria fusca]|uniref:Uncharacterized protein n=1 Tax=Polyplosphaeria fusca TaxID=682080 RepID=A0A9P4QPJ3_9PLEO|nr:hypothetical protein EJ04DRAFT_503932 [Polyplosphaeria fusca]
MDCSETLDRLQAEAIENHHSQSQSPLFSTIPAEIRNEIFKLAVTEYEDPSRPWPRNSYYWRPGFRGHRKVDVALLQTCKRVWLETRPLPFQTLVEAPVAFFLAQFERRPPGLWHPNDKRRHLFRTRPWSFRQWLSVKTMRIFLQGLTTTNISNFLNHHYTQPSTIIFTTRYTDWFLWEKKNPLYLDKHQMASITLPSSVTKVVMEFEMIESRERELKQLLEDVFNHALAYGWKNRSETRMYIRNLEDPWRYVEEWKWDGPTKFGDGQTFAHHPPGDTMTYVVKAVTWEPQDLKAVPQRVEGAKRITAG